MNQKEDTSRTQRCTEGLDKHRSDWSSAFVEAKRLAEQTQKGDFFLPSRFWQGISGQTRGDKYPSMTSEGKLIGRATPWATLLRDSLE